MGQRSCPQCSCDAASVLSFATHNGSFAAVVQCHVCGFETITDHDFQDERAAREAATHAWLAGTESLAFDFRLRPGCATGDIPNHQVSKYNLPCRPMRP